MEHNKSPRVIVSSSWADTYLAQESWQILRPKTRGFRRFYSRAHTGEVFEFVALWAPLGRCSHHCILFFLWKKYYFKHSELNIGELHKAFVSLAIQQLSEFWEKVQRPLASWMDQQLFLSGLWTLCKRQAAEILLNIWKLKSYFGLGKECEICRGEVTTRSKHKITDLQQS